MDRVQAWIRGELSEDEVRELQRELARDPELERWATQYRQVFHLTQDGPLPECRTSADDVAARTSAARSERAPEADPVRAHPLVAFAAALVVGTLAALWLGRVAPSGKPEFVLLASIPSRTLASTQETAIPVRLASYQPVVDGEIRWLDDLAEARSVARATGRRVFVFGTYPNCPIAERVRRDCLATEEVLAMTEEYVPFAVDLTSLPRAEHDEWMLTGYPYMEVEAPTGESKLVFSGTFSEPEFRAKLEAGLADPSEPHLSWSDAHALAERYERARAAEANGRWNEAVEGYGELMSCDGASAFASAGREGLARAGAAAHDFLTEAEQLDAAAAEERLESAVSKFRGTPYEADFDRVLRSVRERGVFPALVWESDSI